MLHCPKSFHPQASALPSLRMPVRCDDSLQKPVCMSNPHEKKGMLHRPSRFSPRAQLLCCTAITNRRNAVSTAWPSLRRSTVSHRCLPKPLKKSIVASAALGRINSIYVCVCIYIYKAWLCGVPKKKNLPYGFPTVDLPLGQSKIISKSKIVNTRFAKPLLSQNHRIPLLVLLLSVSKVIAFKMGVCSNWGYL